MYWLFYLIIIIFGVVVSYTDINVGKIRNKHLIIFSLVGLVAYVFLLVTNYIEIKAFASIMVFTIIGFFLGFVLWFFGMWSAGDAKLYAAFIFLVPIVEYKHVSTVFSPLSIIINTFLPLFVYYLLRILFFPPFKTKLLVLKKVIHPKNILTYLLVVFSLGWIVRWVLFYFLIEPNFFYIIIGIVVLSRLFIYLFKEHYIIVMVVIAIFRVLLDRDFIFTPEFVTSYLLVTIAYAIIIMFIYEMSTLFVKKVKIDDLEEGMVLAELITKEGKRIKPTTYSYSQIQKKGLLVEYSVDGLNDKEVVKLHRAYDDGILKTNYLFVQQTIPFAPFMFLGVLLTIVFNGNVILFLKSLF
ncbi:hypothetical protein HN695_07300 [Candidatus Woesearchaeota archaeon]|jgi:Flp pilus assembly protein protease CpaA|nr:hypothetical protein [Candidatus Woesearchaeota archaeon]MBT6336740.1 hypothetical protein [Candidatus Woesearchaeota archaeon]MBT7928113.1 hypothetical protein [Candidatus Woesearchaeota archaeon]